MLVLNETAPEFQLGNNLFNIDENVSLALCELNEEYNWIMERTNVVLEYGVIHEGVITSIIKALINFFKKVIETLLSIFTSGGSSGGGGGGSGGGGGFPSSPSNDNKKEIKIKHYEYLNYNTKAFDDIITDQCMDIVDAVKRIENLKDNASEEDVKKMFSKLYDGLSDSEIVEMFKDSDIEEKYIDNYASHQIEQILNKVGFSSTNIADMDTLKGELFEFIIGEEKEFTYHKSDIGKIRNTITLDENNYRSFKTLIDAYKHSSDYATKTLEKKEKEVQNANQDVLRLITKSIQIIVKVIKQDSAILIILFNTCLKAIKHHKSCNEKILNKLTMA